MLSVDCNGVKRKLCCAACLAAGPELIYFNLSARTMLKGISVGHDRTTVLTIDGELEKVNYMGADYHVHTLEVSHFFVTCLAATQSFK